MNIKCKDLIKQELEKTILGLKEALEEDRLNEFGLAYDYFENETGNYICYLMSWGGPSDEFRYYITEKGEIQKIEYWYKDWYDGAKIELNSKTEEWDLASKVFEEHGGVKEARKMIFKYHE